MAQLIISSISAELKLSVICGVKACFVLGRQRSNTTVLKDTTNPRWPEEFLFDVFSPVSDTLEIMLEEKSPSEDGTIGVASLSLADITLGRNRRTLTLSHNGRPIGVIAFNATAEGPGWPPTHTRQSSVVDSMVSSAIPTQRRGAPQSARSASIWSSEANGIPPGHDILAHRLQDLEGEVRRLQRELAAQTQRREELYADNVKLAAAMEQLENDNEDLLRVIDEQKYSKEKSSSRRSEADEELAALRKKSAALQRALDAEVAARSQAEQQVEEQRQNLEVLRRTQGAKAAEGGTHYVGPHEEKLCHSLERALADLGVADDLSQWTMQELLDKIRVEAIKLRNRTLGVADGERVELRRQIEATLWRELQIASNPAGYSTAQFLDLLTVKVRNLLRMLELHQQFAIQLAKQVGEPFEEDYFASAVLTVPKLQARLSQLLVFCSPAPRSARGERPSVSFARSPSVERSTRCDGGPYPILIASANPSLAPFAFGDPSRAIASPFRAQRAELLQRPAPQEVPIFGYSTNGRSPSVTSGTDTSRPLALNLVPDRWGRPISSDVERLTLDGSQTSREMGMEDKLSRQLLSTLSDLQRAEVQAQRLNQQMGAQDGRLHSEVSMLSRGLAEARSKLDSLTEAVLVASPPSRHSSRSGTPSRIAVRTESPRQAPEYSNHIFFQRGRSLTTDVLGQRLPSRSRSRSPGSAARVWR